MSRSGLSYRVTPVLIAIGILLSVANWYLQPDRAAAWSATLILFGVMTLAFAGAIVMSGAVGGRRQAADSLAAGTFFAGLMMVVPLSMSLIKMLGGIDTTEVSQRTTMAVVGLWFVFTGNLLPKTLTPLAARRCDGAGMQAAQRAAGWAWVLTGLAYSAIWIWAPLALAKPLSMSVLVIGTLTGASQFIRLCWPRRWEA
jgi:uncharacterized membrane protein